MLTLALDVDGVLLDPERNGDGNWTNELTARFGIERAQLREAFFMSSWDDVINGRRSIEDGLGEALIEIGTTVDVESVLSCWFDADYVPIDAIRPRPQSSCGRAPGRARNQPGAQTCQLSLRPHRCGGSARAGHLLRRHRPPET